MNQTPEQRVEILEARLAIATAGHEKWFYVARSALLLLASHINPLTNEKARHAATLALLKQHENIWQG